MSFTRHHRKAPSILGLSLLWALAACAPEQTARSEADILAVQAERFRAIVDADTEVLDDILATDLVYTHSHGGVDSKADFIAGLSSGAVDYLELDPDNTQVRFYGDAAVVTGEVNLRVAAGGEEHNLAMRFTEVYVYRDDRWQLVSWQSTPMP